MYGRGWGPQRPWRRRWWGAPIVIIRPWGPWRPWRRRWW